ncbi:MAG TPA: LamG-like jellyroll fold domain-containing protein [Pyrinomonadaceae bacterium]|nr:LamG-like jellyroll fold domain-containing protein [Pyrinomonadaceae bacterium]
MTKETLPQPEQLNELWRFAATYGRLSDAQPLIAAGDRILGVAGSTIFSIDIFHGRQPVPDVKGTKPGFPYGLRHAVDPCVTAAGGNVYFMDGNELMALRLSDGLPIQTRNDKDQLVRWNPPELEKVNSLLAVDGKLIALHLGENGNAAVTVFNAVNGKKLFGPVEVYDLTPGGLAYGDGAVFFVADALLHAVNVDFGDNRFERTEGGGASEALLSSVTPCVAGKVVVAAGKNLHFFDVKTGAEILQPIAPNSTNASWFSPITADKGNLIIASNTVEVVAIRSVDGKVMWRTALDAPGKPSLLRKQVVVTTEGGTMLVTLDLASGKPDRRFKLPQSAARIPPIVNNETVFIPDASGSIEARAFGRQHAAYFDGRKSRIDIKADQDVFDFGEDDFTVEAWVRSSEGGEIISSYPTLSDADAHGFRLNIGPNGELRVGVVNPLSKSVHAGRSRETPANDGEWHHLALIRRSGALLALLDGNSLDLYFRDDSVSGLRIGGHCALTIGACIPSKGADATDHFEGLIREVRIWDRALDVATVQNNRHVQLNGTEPRLKALWSLTEVHDDKGPKLDPVNAVPRARHNVHASFLNAASLPTDLALDRSGFPYLLHESDAHWPYAGTWAARGERAVSTAAALADNALAFATNNAIYGVRRSDGRRLWQIDVARRTSAPVADGSRFLALTGDEGLIAINTLTGEYTRLDAFAGLVKSSDTALPEPAVSRRYIAVAGQSGVVKIADRTTDPIKIYDVTLPAPVRQLALGATRLFVCCGSDRALNIATVDPITNSKTVVPVTATAFTVEDDWLFCVRYGFVVRVDANNVEVKTQNAISDKITGMAARPDSDLLVVTTGDGLVHGFAMSNLAKRWDVKLTDERVNEPVFDAAGRVYCTTAAGTIVVLDGASGTRLGLYKTPQSIITPPLVASATAYFGCAEPVSPEAYRDGALHSVVMGETMVLRLGLDERGAPSSSAQPYALVDIQNVDVAKHTLHLMDPTRSCVETWINIPPSRANTARRPGGGVFGICPTQDGGFDINLSVDEDGTLHYSSRSRAQNQWRMLRAEAATQLTDGQWHHLALSRDRADHVAIYIDGQLLSDVTVEQTQIAAPKTVTGIKAFIGATAGDDLAAVRPLCGMIAELRLWDTYMEPQEIAARMHVKLRGSEPDLLAYWNFDRKNIEDAGPDQHNGKLVDAGSHPLWWLTDLAFEKPSYPFITTRGNVLPQPAGRPPMYEVTFAVHSANGSGLPDHPLEVWYLQRRDDEPTNILIDGTSVEGVKGGVTKTPYSATTGSDGSVTVVVTPTNPNHVPAIDVRAGFMPGNERFHVNVLLNQQVHFVPVPPSLVAQSRLIQDYAYTRGNKIDEKRDRSTWRTVIKAVESDGSPRGNEPVSVWATEQLDVEVSGQRYSLNKENSVELVTDSAGEVIIVFDADELNATALMARAGFMHRNDRVTIAPDQDLHRQLTTVKGSDFTKKRPVVWTRDMDENDGEPLLKGDLAPHADKVAEAINKVMASAKPADANPTPAPRGNVQLLRSKARAKSGLLRNDPIIDTMRQPVFSTAVDSVVMLRSQAHAPRVTPLNPEGLRTALDGNAGFVFETTNKTLRFEMLKTQAQVDAERGEPTPEPIVLRGFFDDLWDAVVDTATNIYDGAVKVVVSIAETVQIAITKMVEGISKIVHVVVDSIIDAANAVANFFEQIGVAIMKAIEFLRTLFNWKAILATKDIIQEIFIDSVENAKRAMSKENLRLALGSLTGVPDMKPKAGPSLSAQGKGANEARSAALDEANGVQGQMMMQKSRDGISSVVASSEAPRESGAGRDVFEELIKSIPLIVPQLAELSPVELMNKLLALAKDGFDKSIRLFIDGLVEISSVAIDLIDWGMKLLRARINIPFISELYEFITGSPLTLLDVVCLAMAVPVHVAHVAITTLRGNTRTFAQDNEHLADQLRAAASGKPLRSTLLGDEPVDDMEGPPQPRPKPMNTDSEVFLLVLRGINIAAGLASDTLFARAIGAGGFSGSTPGMARWRGLAKTIKGATGIAASYVQTFKSMPAFEERVKSGLHPKDYAKIKPPEGAAEAVFAVLTAGDSITFAGGIKHMLCPPAPVAKVNGFFPPDGLDKTECNVAVGAAFGCIGLIGTRLHFLQHQMGNLEIFRADDKLIKQALFFGLRDLFMIFARMPWFMFTQEGANRIIKKFPGGAEPIYGGVVAARALFQILAVGTHVISVEVYGS